MPGIPRSTLRLASLALLAGCTTGAVVLHPPEAGPMDVGLAAQVDAGMTIEPPDTGCEPAPPIGDAGLGPLVDPPIAPDERPSDSPAAAMWIDPPVSTTGPSFDFGSVVTLEESNVRVSRGTVAWTGSQYATFWYEFGALDASGCGTLYHQPLDTGGAALAGARAIPGPGAAWGADWLTDRFVVAGPGELWLVDLTGTVVASAIGSDSFIAGATAPQRFPVARGWITVRPFDFDRSGVAMLDLRDDALRVVGGYAVHFVDGQPLYRSLGLSVVGSRLVVSGRSLYGDFAEILNGSLVMVAGRVYLPTDGAVRSQVRIRDGVLMLSRLAETRAFVLDPFAAAVVSDTLEGVPQLGRNDLVSLAADDEGGTVGACWIEGGVGDHVVHVALMGLDGRLIGPVLDAPTGPLQFGSCNIASGARDEYMLVIGATHRSPDLAPRRFAVPMHVRR